MRKVTQKVVQDEHEFDLWLGRALKREADHLNDDGFTDRVMAAVLAPRRAGKPVAVAWTLVLAVLAGILGLVLFPGWGWIYELAGTVATVSVVQVLQLGMAVALIMIGTAALLLWNEP